MIKTNYDAEHDILYIFSGEPRVGCEDEVSSGIYLRKAEDTDEVIRAIIMDYRKRLGSDRPCSMSAKKSKLEIKWRQLSKSINQ